MLDGPPLVLVGAASAMLGVGADRIQDRIPLCALADIALHFGMAAPDIAVVAVETINSKR